MGTGQAYRNVGRAVGMGTGMSEEMEIQRRINELVEEKTRRELAERTPEEKEKDETFLADFYTWKKEREGGE